MGKSLGMALGPETRIFDMMRLHGANIDYLQSDTERLMNARPTVQRKFAETECFEKYKSKLLSDFPGGSSVQHR